MRMKDYKVNKPSGFQYYSWSEVVKHDKDEDCWVVIHGNVYDVTGWVPHHPGGKMIFDGAGGDCTAMWESYHPLALVQQGVPDKYLIGKIIDYEDFYSWGGDFYKTIKTRVEA
jgi:cytochrome b involved in lipid metabolism